MFFRRPLMVLLGLGVIAGYGSALGHMRHRWGQGPYGHDCGSWSRYEQTAAPVVAPPAPVVTAPAPAPAPQQQLVPQIIIVQPQAVPPSAAPTVIVQPPAQAAPAPVQVVVPKTEQPAKAPNAE